VVRRKSTEISGKIFVGHRKKERGASVLGEGRRPSGKEGGILEASNSRKKHRGKGRLLRIPKRRAGAGGWLRVWRAS